MHACILACMHTHTHKHIYMHTHIHTYAYASHIHIHAYMHNIQYAYIHTYAYTYIHAYMIQFDPTNQQGFVQHLNSKHNRDTKAVSVGECHVCG